MENQNPMHQELNLPASATNENHEPNPNDEHGTDSYPDSDPIDEAIIQRKKESH